MHQHIPGRDLRGPALDLDATLDELDRLDGRDVTVAAIA